MKTLLNIIILSLATILPVGKEELQDSKYAKHLISAKKPLLANSLTITKLKKPWYAGRGMVIRKMEETLTEYKTLPGLNQKYYSFTSDYKFLGGIYLWQTKKDIQNWFNEEWYLKMAEKYGAEAIVDRYEVLETEEFNTLGKSKGRFCGVISYAPGRELNWSGEGALVRVLTLKDDKGQACYFSLWKTEDDAKLFLTTYGITNQFFDVPLLLNPE